MSLELMQGNYAEVEATTMNMTAWPNKAEEAVDGMLRPLPPCTMQLTWLLDVVWHSGAPAPATTPQERRRQPGLMKQRQPSEQARYRHHQQQPRRQLQAHGYHLSRVLPRFHGHITMADAGWVQPNRKMMAMDVLEMAP